VVVSTDPLPRACSEQILKDERFHGRFGFEALAVLVPTLDEAEKGALQEQLGRALAGFERTTCGKTRVEDLVGHEVEIAPSTDPEGHPNLGTLTQGELWADLPRARGGGARSDAGVGGAREVPRAGVEAAARSERGDARGGMIGGA